MLVFLAHNIFNQYGRLKGQDAMTQRKTTTLLSTKHSAPATWRLNKKFSVFLKKHVFDISALWVYLR